MRQNNSWGQRISKWMAGNVALLAVGVHLIGAVGCKTDDGRSVRIVQNQVPEAEEEGGCTVPLTETVFNSQGKIDTNAEFGYIFTPLIENNAEESGSNPTQRVVRLEGAEIEITFRDPELFSEADLASESIQALTQFSRRFSGSIEPNGSKVAVIFDILPKALLDRIALALAGQADKTTDVDVSIEVFGNMSGRDVTSEAFSYPIQVCTGCLKRQTDPSACTDITENGAPGGACQPFQDGGIVECCTKSDDSELCPAVPEVL